MTGHITEGTKTGPSHVRIKGQLHLTHFLHWNAVLHFSYIALQMIPALLVNAMVLDTLYK